MDLKKRLKLSLAKEWKVTLAVAVILTLVFLISTNKIRKDKAELWQKYNQAMSEVSGLRDMLMGREREMSEARMQMQSAMDRADMLRKQLEAAHSKLRDLGVKEEDMPVAPPR